MRLGFDPPAGGTLRADVQVRYHHRPAPAEITVDGRRGQVVFDAPQSAVTPGQGAAFYDGDRLLGGGWIDVVERLASPKSAEARDVDGAAPARARAGESRARG